MAFLGGLIRAVNALNKLVGNVFAWLAIGIVFVCFWVVVERYLFSTTRLWMQDLYVWLNGAMFTAVAGFALMRDNHVRVDIYYRKASDRGKALADIVGTAVFLMPFAYIVFLYSIPFVQRSWRLYEGSANVGGMPGLFILKTFILAFAVLLALQGAAMLMRSILILGGRPDLVPEDYRYEQHREAE